MKTTAGETMVGDTDISIPYDMLHPAPPQAAPRFVRESRLANAQGWLDEHQYLAAQQVS